MAHSGNLRPRGVRTVGRMGDDAMRVVFKTLIVLVGLSTAALPRGADAGSGDSSDWQFSFAPYLWVSSIEAEVSVRGQTLGSAEAATSASFVELAEDLDFAFLGHAEARKGRWGLFVDGLYLKLSPEGQTGPVSLGPASTSGFNVEMEFEATILEFGGFYRLGQWELTDRGAEGPQLSLEGLLGVRYTGLDVDMRVTGTISGPLGALSRQVNLDMSPNLDLVDPIVGARALIEIDPDWTLGLRGDIGGFGVGSEFAWNIVGVVTYQAWENVDLLAGYRALSYDIESSKGAGNADLDITLHGPVLAAVFRW